MPKSTALERVEADLAVGRTQPAIQRLSSLVHNHPADLDLRRQLAAVHRRVGNLIEAGRWGYLLADTPAEEIAAFERAYPQPDLRLRRLRWPGTAADAPTEYTRDRLLRLASAAPRRGGIGGTVWSAATAVVIAGFLALVLVGAVTVLQWLLR
jgi:hypothetical protein